MFGNMSGPTLLLLLLVGLVLLVVVGAIVGLIVWAIKKSGRTKAEQQAELQRAYEAGLNQPRN